MKCYTYNKLASKDLTTPFSDVGKGLLICKTLSSQILHFGEVIT